MHPDSVTNFSTAAFVLLAGLPTVTSAPAPPSAADIEPGLSVDDYVAAERAVALDGTVRNIGEAAGAAPGIVIASPSTSNPDYFYTWTRDAGLTMKMVVDEFVFGADSSAADLQVVIEDYLTSQAVLQTVTNPSGGLQPDGQGLGEPKFNADGSQYTGAWGRPQRDGPALRAVALLAYTRWVAEQGDAERAARVLWPVIANDLSYVGQYWNQTGFDLWEEVQGSSFFTTLNQYRALVEGAALAETLGVECTGCDQAAQVLCFLQSAYWNGKYLTANVNANNGRTGIDANPMLGSISVFDVDASCDGPTFQPCNSQSLANFKVFVDTFRSLYPINDGIAENEGVAVGRYPEDVYSGDNNVNEGNPWYLITLGSAEFLWDAVAQWDKQGQVTIDETSLSFFQDLVPDVQATTYASSGDTYQQIITAVGAYADSFVSVVQTYTPTNGSLSEQFRRTDGGYQLSARDLTWSFAAFVTMAERRAGQFPPGWAQNITSADVPATCQASSTPGAYAPATEAGAGNSTDGCAVAASFSVDATTYYGEGIFLVGNTEGLGNWNPDRGMPMSAAKYTPERPVWSFNVQLPAETKLEYKYVRKEDCGQGYIWETSDNRQLTVPECGGAAISTDDVWVGPSGTSGGC